MEHPTDGSGRDRAPKAKRAKRANSYALPSGPMTPKKRLEAARIRVAARRKDLKEQAAPDRRTIASAALEILLKKDAEARAQGGTSFDVLFEEIVAAISGQIGRAFDPEQVTLQVSQLRAVALEKFETGRRPSRRQP